MFSKITIVGRSGKDATTKVLNDGTEFVVIPVATNDYKKLGDNEWKQNVTWFDIVVYNKYSVQQAAGLLKGSLVYAEGKLQHRAYVDNSGQAHSSLSVIVSTGGVFKVLLSPKADSTQNTTELPPELTNKETFKLADKLEDDIPF